MGTLSARRPVRRTSRMARVAALALAGALGAAAPSAAEKPDDDQSTVEGNVAGELSFLAAPPFPELDISEALRMHLALFTAPQASIGDGDMTVVRPELRARLTWLATERFVSRIALQLAETQYDFQGDVWGTGTDVHPITGQTFDADERIGDLDLHAFRIAIDGARLISDSTDWFVKGERWSVVGSIYGGSRWENGDFDDGTSMGGALGFGYEVGKRLRLALGVSLRSPFHDAEVDLDPIFALRWRPNELVTLRTRELGLQVEVGVTPAFGLFIAGFRSSDGYRLSDRPGFGDLSFRERHIRIGGGIDWILANWLQLELEMGALLDRRIRVHEEDLGTLLSRRSDPSPYVEIRFEIHL